MREKWGRGSGAGGQGNEEIRRLLAKAGALLGTNPGVALAAAEDARTRAQAGHEHWLLAESLNVLARAHQSAGDATHADGRALECLGLALALHDVEAEQKALSLLDREEGRKGGREEGNPGRAARLRGGRRGG